MLLECVRGWEGNWTWDCFIAWAWLGRDGRRIVIVVNYAANQSQCYVRLPFTELGGHQVRLTDLMGGPGYERDGTELVTRGLFVDLPPWGHHLFDMADT